MKDIVGDELLENGRKTYSNQICAAAAGLWNFGFDN